jgi:hypothetical protein
VEGCLGHGQLRGILSVEKVHQIVIPLSNIFCEMWCFFFDRQNRPATSPLSLRHFLRFWT